MRYIKRGSSYLLERLGNAVKKNMFALLVDLCKLNDGLLVEGKLNKNRIVDLAIKCDESLLSLLLQEELIKNCFFKKINHILVFDTTKFLQFVNNKQFLADSYTVFKNKIGLMVQDTYLSQGQEVVLVWPYKECFLLGGQTKEDQKRQEIFWNQTLAADEITSLLAPKVLTKFRRFNKEGVHSVKELFDEDNWIIKGNNLLVLHSLKKRYAGKVKLIYIDPPYNTGNDSFNYNDSFNHATWLTFMKNRLTIAKELLREDGVIFVQCDDSEQAYLKVLMDEIFGRSNFINTVGISMKEKAGASGGGEDKKLKKKIEFGLIFSKNRNNFRYNKSVRDWKKVTLKHFAYKSVLLSKEKYDDFYALNGKICLYKYSVKSIKALHQEENISLLDVYKKYFHSIFRVSNSQTSIRDKVNALVKENDKGLYSYTYRPNSGKNKDRDAEVFYIKGNQVIFLSDNHIIQENEIIKKETISNLWDDIKTTGLSEEGDITFRNGKKPEQLIYKIMALFSDKGDMIGDFYLGSGTTCAVAHKMGRRYIGIEQMDYIHEFSCERIKKVIHGEQSGISKIVNWQGGGSFVYCELAEDNASYIALS